jgi:hypothetical protein
MPIIVILLIVVLVAIFGFWDTLQAGLGAIGIIALLVLFTGALVVAVGAGLIDKLKRRLSRHR